MGKLDYFIDIGLHNTTDEHLVPTFDGNVYMTDREINKVLKEHGLKRADVQEDLSLFFKGRTASEKLQEISIQWLQEQLELLSLKPKR